MVGFTGTQTSFNTINAVSIFKALNLPGQPVNDYCREVALEVARLAKLKAPINNVLNAGHRGGKVGTYHDSFIIARSPVGGLREVTYYAANRARHAFIVERGKPYVRKRQVFTWEHAVGNPKRVGSRGAKGRFVTTGQGRPAYSRPKKPGALVSTPVVHAWGYKSVYNPTPAPRRGHRTMEDAATTVAKKRGLRRNLNLTV